MSGCTLEQKLAKSYVKANPADTFFVLRPEFLFKTNLKAYEVEDSAGLSEEEQASLLFEKSLFLKDISDSLMISEFVGGLTSRLKKYGAVVMLENAVDSVLVNGGHPVVFNIAQFTLEEFLHPYSAEQVVYDEVLVIDGFDVNAINYNIWIELSMMNTERKNKVLFTSDYLTDDVDGMFRQNLFTGKVIFDFTIDTITISRTYEFARQFGERSAALVFDYLMNTYVLENLPEGYPYDPYYYHYDPEKKILYTIGEEDRIMILEDN